jgi:hypothetical protein
MVIFTIVKGSFNFPDLKQTNAETVKWILNKHRTPAKQNDERENEKSRCDQRGNKMVIVDVILFIRSTRKIMSPTPQQFVGFPLSIS